MSVFWVFLGKSSIQSVDQARRFMEFITNPSKSGSSELTFLFAHGAGAPMDSDFMSEVADLFAERGVNVVRFEFPYMQERRVSGKKRPPDRAPKLLACFQEAIEQLALDSGHLFIGGKSMGGRMASMLAAESGLPIKGCMCFGYPYHAPGKPEKVRNEHFADLQVPILVLQGERDAFGTKEEILGYSTFDHVEHIWITDGNHDLKPRKASGVTQQENLVLAVESSVAWMQSVAQL
jgi:predicted alpha/beta-hydrolase family hydrolase